MIAEHATAKHLAQAEALAAASRRGPATITTIPLNSLAALDSLNVTKNHPATNGSSFPFVARPKIPDVVFQKHIKRDPKENPPSDPKKEVRLKLFVGTQIHRVVLRAGLCLFFGLFFV
jgi:hypothetical protein